MKTKFIKSCEKKLKKMTGKVTTPCKFCERICWGFKSEAEVIPKDVPKGHLVVYVGEESMRFVIKISLLAHPLFKALLDQAQDAYGFSADSRLWIPCDVSTFLDVVRCAEEESEEGESEKLRGERSCGLTDGRLCGGDAAARGGGGGDRTERKRKKLRTN
ncbi:hypothetical protein Bca4012_081859 [Brassica carinata]